MTEVTTIDRDDLAARLERGEIVLIEALGPAAFAAGHLPGARDLLPQHVETRAAEIIPHKDAAIVVYCADAACRNSATVARKLKRLGYTDVGVYEAGKEDWLAAGLPIEIGVAEAPGAPGAARGA